MLYIAIAIAIERVNSNAHFNGGYVRSIKFSNDTAGCREKPSPGNDAAPTREQRELF